MSNKQKVILLTMLIANLAALGTFGAAAYLAGPSEVVPVVTLMPTMTKASATDPAPAPLTIPTLPPAWTATYTPPPTTIRESAVTNEPTLTATPMPTTAPAKKPTLTAMPPSQTPHQAAQPTQPQRQVGSSYSGHITSSGSQETQRVTFQPEVTILVQWSYSGDPSGGSVPDYETTYHNDLLRTEKTWYDNTKAMYNSQLQQAAAHQDALAMVQIQQDIKDLDAQYQREVDAENQRYASVPKVDNTQFKLWVNRDTPGPQLFLDDGTGPSNGQVTFVANGGNDYYFLVSASGSWTLDVFPMP